MTSSRQSLSPGWLHPEVTLSDLGFESWHLCVSLKQGSFRGWELQKPPSEQTEMGSPRIENRDQRQAVTSRGWALFFVEQEVIIWRVTNPWEFISFQKGECHLPASRVLLSPELPSPPRSHCKSLSCQNNHCFLFFLNHSFLIQEVFLIFNQYLMYLPSPMWVPADSPTSEYQLFSLLSVDC